MISVGVEITSYLIKNRQALNYTDQKKIRHRQFDDVRMSKGSHVFKLSSNTGFSLFAKNNSL